MCTLYCTCFLLRIFSLSRHIIKSTKNERSDTVKDNKNCPLPVDPIDGTRVYIPSGERCTADDDIRAEKTSRPMPPEGIK